MSNDRSLIRNYYHNQVYQRNCFETYKCNQIETHKRNYFQTKHVMRDSGDVGIVSVIIHVKWWCTHYDLLWPNDTMN